MSDCLVLIDGEWVDAWLVTKSGRYAYIRLTTRGPEQKVPLGRIRTGEAA